MKGSILLIVIVLVVVGFFTYNFTTQDTQITSESGQTLAGKSIQANDFLEKQAAKISQTTDQITAKVTTQTKEVAAVATKKTEELAQKATDKVKEISDSAKDMKVTEPLAEITKKAEGKVAAMADALDKATAETEERAVKLEAQLAKTAEPIEEVQEPATDKGSSVLEKNASRFAEKIKELIDLAKKQLEQGDFQEAAVSAQKALNMNPNSAEAKGILEQAKEKIASIGEIKTEEFKVNLSDKIGDTQSALGSLGE